MLNSVDAIVEAVGGVTAAASLTGVSSPAVSNWKARGSIPAEYFAAFADELDRRRKRFDRTVFGFRPVAKALRR